MDAVLKRLPIFQIFFALCCAGVFAGEDADFQSARGLYGYGEYKLAIEALEKFVNAYPKSERLEEAQFFLADSYYLSKQYAEATSRFEKYIAAYANSPRRADALMRAAKAFWSTKDYQKAQKYAETFIEENRAKVKDASRQDPLLKKMALALYYAGDSSFELKAFDKAQRYWEECLPIEPDSELAQDAQEGLGYIYFEKKLYDKAAASFRAVSAWTYAPNKNKPDELVHHRRAARIKMMEGRALGELKKYDEALAAFKAAPGLTGTDPNLEAECALRSADLALQAGKTAEALVIFGKIVQDYSNFPSTPATVKNAVMRLYEAKNFAPAAELAAQYLKLTQASPGAGRATVARIRAFSLRELNKIPEATEAARISLKEADGIVDKAEQESERAPALLLLAELDPKEAQQHYAEVKDKYASTGYARVALYELARMAGEAAQFDKALTLSEELLESLSKAAADAPGVSALKRKALYAAGIFAFQKPDYKKALQHLAAYLKEYGDKDEHADDAASKLAWSQHETGDDAGAIATLDPALNAYPKSPLRSEMLYVRAVAANKTGKSDDALKFDEMLVAEFPTSPFFDDALFDAAAILYSKEQLPQSLTKLDTLLARPNLKPQLRVRALQIRASINFKDNKFEPALKDAEELLANPSEDIKPNLPALRLIKALSLLSNKDREKDALVALNELIDKGPADAPQVRTGRLRRAALLFSNKSYAEAKADYVALSDPAKAATPDEAAEAALRLAFIHKELKETKEARALLEKLSEQKLQGITAYDAPNELGNILFEAKDDAGAAKSYERALAAAAGRKDIPTDSLSATRLNYARALRLSKDDKADKAYAELIKEDPKGKFTADALFERAELLAEVSKTADAVEAWQQLQKDFPENPLVEKALFKTAQGQAQMNKFEEAAASFEAHVTKFPNANTRETYAGLAESRLHLNDLEKAKTAFKKVVGDKGEDAELDDVTERALLGLAEIAMKSDDPTSAKKLVLRIILGDEKSQWIDSALFFSGQASEALKEPEKAIGYYRKLLTDKPASTHAKAAQERLTALGAPK